MFSLIGTALELSTSLVKMASAIQVKDYSTWKSGQLGNKAEDTIFRILSYLEAEVYLAPCGSALDCQLKADIVMQTGDNSFVYQVKSSQTGADSHFSKEPVLVMPDGSKQAYPACGCIISSGAKSLGESMSPMELLLAVSEQTGIPLKPIAQEAANMARKLSGRTLPTKLFTKNYTALLELGLAKLCKGDLSFN